MLCLMQIEISRKNFLNFRPKLLWVVFILLLGISLWWFDFAFLILLLSLFLNVLHDFQSLDLLILAFFNVLLHLFITFLVSVSSQGHGLPFIRFSICGASLLKVICNDDVKYTGDSTSVASYFCDQSIFASSDFSSSRE